MSKRREREERGRENGRATKKREKVIEGEREEEKRGKERVRKT